VSPRIVVFIGVFFAATSAVLIKASGAHPLAIAFYRMFFVSILLIPQLGRTGWRRIRAMTRRQIRLCLIGGIFLGFHFATWISSLSFTSVASATVLVNTHPILVMVFGLLFLGERIPWDAVAWMVLALAGSIVLSLGGLQGDSGQLIGNLLAFGGAVSAAGYMLVGRAVRQDIDTRVYTFVVYSISAVVLFIMTLIGRVQLTGYPWFEFAIFVGLAVFPTLLGHSLFNWALKYVKTSLVSTAILGEPIFASVMALFIFSEVPGIYTLIGGPVIIVSIYFFTRAESRAARRAVAAGAASGGAASAAAGPAADTADGVTGAAEERSDNE
jgi:drug/metabolite transporter (DMT)-like permease